MISYGCTHNQMNGINTVNIHIYYNCFMGCTSFRWIESVLNMIIFNETGKKRS